MARTRSLRTRSVEIDELAGGDDRLAKPLPGPQWPRLGADTLRLENRREAPEIVGGAGDLPVGWRPAVGQSGMPRRMRPASSRPGRSSRRLAIAAELSSTTRSLSMNRACGATVVGMRLPLDCTRIGEVKRLKDVVETATNHRQINRAPLDMHKPCPRSWSSS